MERMAEIKEAVEQAKAQAELGSAVKALTVQVERLTTTVEENNRRLERLSVLEANHSNQSSALGRAFDSIDEVKEDVSTFKEKNAKEHKSYDRYVWTVIGACVALSGVWSILGYRMMNSIDHAQESVARMELHIQQDKMLSEQDARNAVSAK